MNPHADKYDTANTWPKDKVTDINPQEKGAAMAANLPAMLYTPKYSPTLFLGANVKTKDRSET